MITAELRRAILAAAGHDHDPLLRPGPQPGSYTSSLPFRLAPETRQALAARLKTEPWIATVEIDGYLTVTVTHDALASLAVRIARAGPACAASDALRGRTAPGPAGADLTAAPDWPSARAALAAQLTARLAATAGATISFYAERTMVPPSIPPSPVAVAVAYAGLDAVRFALAATPPGGVPAPAEVIARHVLGNPAYAVRYAHAAAAAVLRWAASLDIRTRRVQAAPAHGTPGAGAARRVVLAPGTGGHGRAPRPPRRVRRVPGRTGSADD